MATYIWVNIGSGNGLLSDGKSHYLNQCWLIISEVLWHSPVGNFTWIAEDLYPWREFKNYLFKITSTSPKGQWVNALPDDLFDNERCKHALGNIITALQEEVTRQNEVDDVYDKLISTIHEGMDVRLDYKDYSPGTKKRARRNKPDWNDDLAKLWKDARDSENAYLKSKGSTRERRHLLTHFKNKRNDFDKQLRQAQKKYYREQQSHLHTLCTDDPKEFWRHMNRLGPEKSDLHAPNSVELDNGHITSDPEVVLQKWKTDIEGLYQINQIYTSETTEFLNNLNQMSQRWEHEFSEIHKQGPRTNDEDEAGRIRRANEMLNRPITLHETTNILKRTRNGKAVCVDNVSNEILKIPLLQECLHELFQRCFEYNVIPRLWYKVLIHPILKKENLHYSHLITEGSASCRQFAKHSARSWTIG